jgi:hypothetical protein
VVALSNALQAAYESAGTMRRSFTMMQAEMNEFQIAATAPRDEQAMERARAAVHAHADAYLDAMAVAMVVADGSRMVHPSREYR